MVRIVSVETRDLSFRLAPGEGTDAVHDSSKYGYSVVIVHTTSDDPAVAAPTGFGIAFTLGAGESVIGSLAKALAEPLIGQEISDVFKELGKWQNRISNHPQWRWVGPHKGVVSLA